MKHDKQCIAYRMFQNYILILGVKCKVVNYKLWKHVPFLPTMNFWNLISIMCLTRGWNHGFFFNFNFCDIQNLAGFSKFLQNESNLNQKKFFKIFPILKKKGWNHFLVDLHVKGHFTWQSKDQFEANWALELKHFITFKNI